MNHFFGPLLKKIAPKVDPRPSEVLYSFVAWLSSRDNEITFGSHSEVPEAIEVLNEFCNTNDFEDPRTTAHWVLKFPEE